MARKAKGKRAPRRAAAAGAAAAAGDVESRIIDAAMQLIAGRGWRNVALGDIAGAANLSLAQLYAVFPSKLAVLDAFERRINERTLEGGVEAGESVRDRLFDLIMRRLDALAPYREAVRALMRDLPFDPSIALCTGPRFLNAMRWMGEAAGISTGGLFGLLRVKGLAAVYLATLRAWVDDDTEDKARTMAALDRALKRAEMLIQSLPGLSRRPAPQAA